MPNKTPQPRPDLDAEQDTALDRTLSLSDGIYGFSMTLLAVNLTITGVARSTDTSQVTQQVYTLIENFGFFAVSFLLVGLYWQVHRRVFHLIDHTDVGLSWLNILQLLFVAFVPVPTGLFISYPEVPIVVQLYAGTLLAIGLIGALILRHASVAGLFQADVSPELVRYLSFRGTYTIIIYLLIVLIAFFDTRVSRIVFIAFLFGYPFLQRVYRIIYPVPLPEKTITQ